MQSCLPKPAHTRPPARTAGRARTHGGWLREQVENAVLTGYSRGTHGVLTGYARGLAARAGRERVLPLARVARGPAVQLGRQGRRKALCGAQPRNSRTTPRSPHARRALTHAQADGEKGEAHLGANSNERLSPRLENFKYTVTASKRAEHRRLYTFIRLTEYGTRTYKGARARTWGHYLRTGTSSTTSCTTSCSTRRCSSSASSRRSQSCRRYTRTPTRARTHPRRITHAHECKQARSRPHTHASTRMHARSHARSHARTPTHAHARTQVGDDDSGDDSDSAAGVSLANAAGSAASGASPAVAPIFQIELLFEDNALCFRPSEADHVAALTQVGRRCDTYCAHFLCARVRVARAGRALTRSAA